MAKERERHDNTEANPPPAAAYHITNNQPDLTMGLFVATALTYFPENPAPQQLSHSVSYVICVMVEFLWWFTQGNVFAPRHPVWNFTRASLGYMSTDQTFATDGNELISYEPIFNVEESMEDMLEKLDKGRKKY